MPSVPRTQNLLKEASGSTKRVKKIIFALLIVLSVLLAILYTENVIENKLQPAAISLAFVISFVTRISLILVPVILLIAYDIRHVPLLKLWFKKPIVVEANS